MGAQGQYEGLMMVVTGSAFPIGDGGVGKTALARAFSFYTDCEKDIICSQNTKKTVNMEFEFVKTQCEHKEEAVMIQLYVPPGQRMEEQESELGTFEKILDTYEFMPNMQKIAVLLLVFKINEFSTFAVLEKWLDTVLLRGLVKDYTSIMLVGTHMDVVDREVEEYQIIDALNFTRERVLGNTEHWKGNISYALVSNTTGQGICDLKRKVATMVCLANIIRQNSNPLEPLQPCPGCTLFEGKIILH
jgi:hypothetical protein